jgi:hypothetical protein
MRDRTDAVESLFEFAGKMPALRYSSSTASVLARVGVWEYRKFDAINPENPENPENLEP